MNIANVIADTLKSAAPEAQWYSGGVDRALELADLMINAGIVDLSKININRIDDYEALALSGSTVTKAQIDAYNAGGYKNCNKSGDRRDNAWAARGTLCPAMGTKAAPGKTPADVLAQMGFLPFVFVYEGRRIGFLGDANNDGGISNSAPLFKYHGDGLAIAWSARGKGGCTYLVTGNQNGFAFVPAWGRSGDKQFYQQAIVTGLSVWGAGFAFAGLNMGTMVGRSLVSAEFAAAYPKLTAALGQTVLTTAANGGDVEGALTSTVASFGAGLVGAQVAGLTDSEVAGKLARSASAAALTGGDPKAAVQNQLVMMALTAGADKARGYFESDQYSLPSPAPLSIPQLEPLPIPEIVINPEPVKMEISLSDWNGGIENYSPFGDVSFGSMPAVADWSFDQSPLIAPSVNDTFGIPSVMAFAPDVGGPAGNPFANIFGNTLPPAAAPQPAVIPGASGRSGWDYAKEALKFVPGIVKALKDPKPAGSGVIAADGSVNARALSPNQPVVLPDGRIIVRGTDGNITMVDQRGNVIGGGGMFGLSPLAIGGIAAGALALFFLARRR